jgi:CRP-like cAMP-binding protein
MDGSLFDAVPDEDRQALLQLARRRRFARKEVVFHEGDPGDTVHVIVSGHVAVRNTTPLGDVAMLRVLGPGQHFGELALVSEGPRNATVVALDAVETRSVPRSHFDELRRKHPAIDKAMMEALVGEVRRLSHQLQDLMYVPVDKRLCRRLAELADLYDSDGAVTIPITQEDLAQLTGTTRPTANKVLRMAEADGLIAVARGRIQVIDRETLRRRAR